MPLNVTVVNPKKIIFEGKARNVTLPGEQGTFDILIFHKRLLSRLVSGMVIIDGQSFPIRRGIAKVNQNKVIIIVEEQL